LCIARAGADNLFSGALRAGGGAGASGMEQF
jgi:hypothetical protein